jgi:hypothetical protein
MRVSSPHLPLAALVLASLLRCGSHAESTKISDPQTEGEKRLMEWDTTRKFIPSKSSFSGGSASGSKSAPVNSFETRSFLSKNSVSTASFYTPEFLSSSRASSGLKTFSTKSAAAGAATGMSSPFSLGKTSPEPKTFSGAGKTSDAQKAASDASRDYLGPESEKMKQKYTPQNAPKGGITTGHQLSVEEVRGILNRNK